MSRFNKSRRHFLRNTAVLTTGSLVMLNTPMTLAAALNEPVRTLSLYNLHTGESGNFVFWEKGEYIKQEIANASRLLRDHRTGESLSMDPNLLDTLHYLQRTVGSHHRFEVISGYRSPKSNMKLRRTDKKGVAKKSFHMKGQAIDVRLPGTELAHLRKAARELRRGGVGYYPSSNFIHLDTGWVRSWREKA